MLLSFLAHLLDVHQTILIFFASFFLSIAGIYSCNRCSRTFSSSRWSLTPTLSLISIPSKHRAKTSPLCRAWPPHSFCSPPSPLRPASPANRKPPLTRWRCVPFFVKHSPIKYDGVKKNVLNETFITFLFRNCWIVLTMTMNRRLERKQRRMTWPQSPPCKLLMCCIYYNCSVLPRRGKCWLIFFLRGNEMKAWFIFIMTVCSSLQPSRSTRSTLNHRWWTCRKTSRNR